MKLKLIKLLLAVLNNRFLNQSPGAYGFIGNVEAFSYSHLASEEQQRPGITVKTILVEADAFRSCPISKTGLSVIEDGVAREGTVWDVHDLQTEVAERERDLAVKQTDSWIGNANREQALRKLAESELELANKRIREMREAQWVSVKDRLPDYGTVSLVFCSEGDGLPYQELAGFSYHGGWSVGTPIRTGVTVTHWQPLPEPPSAALLSGQKEKPEC
jgi:hypothetical protein